MVLFNDRRNKGPAKEVSYTTEGLGPRVPEGLSGMSSGVHYAVAKKPALPKYQDNRGVPGQPGVFHA